MADCVKLATVESTPDVLVLDLDSSAPDCAQAALLSSDEYQAFVSLQSENQQFETYFAFDKDLFLEIQGWMLLTFVVGFGVGKVINVLNIANRI